MNLLPEQELLLSLHEEWNNDKALVLADWCEEHGLIGAASSLRAGPSAEARGRIEALCICVFANHEPSRLIHWQLEWLPGYVPTAKEQKFVDKKKKKGLWLQRLRAELTGLDDVGQVQATQYQERASQLLKK